MNEFKILLQAIYATVGNKVYLRSFESLLKKIEAMPLDAHEKQALVYLARDLRELKQQSDSKRII